MVLTAQVPLKLISFALQLCSNLESSGDDPKDVTQVVGRAGESASAWQRHCEPSKGPVSAKLESNSEPERARVCQRVAVRASESQTLSHREPLRARERQKRG